MSKSCLVLQPHGLGDCIFAQGLVKQLGFDEVVWPVTEQYKYDLQRAYPDILWWNENLHRAIHTISKQMIALPIRWSDTITGVGYRHVMRAKYDMYGLDYKTWINYAMWKRNPTNELELFKLTDQEPYNLICANFTGQFKTKIIHVNNGLRNIYLNPINGYSLFDWAMVMEKATEIHFVASSSLYMLECLSPQAEKIWIYQRGADEPHNRYDYLFNRHKYIYV